LLIWQADIAEPLASDGRDNHVGTKLIWPTGLVFNLAGLVTSGKQTSFAGLNFYVLI
jgi:hypothetical protein